MPFDRKYFHMGPTERIRIPEKPKAHIENILEKFDKLYGMNPDDKIREEFEKLMIMYEKALDGLIKKGLTTHKNRAKLLRVPKETQVPPNKLAH